MKTRSGAVEKEGFNVLVIVIIAVAIVALVVGALTFGQKRTGKLAKDTETKSNVLESTDPFS